MQNKNKHKEQKTKQKKKGSVLIHEEQYVEIPMDILCQLKLPNYASQLKQMLTEVSFPFLFLFPFLLFSCIFANKISFCRDQET